MKNISYEQFQQVDIRSGTIIKAESFERVIKPAYKIWAEFGEQIGILQTSAQVTVNYSLTELIGKQILGCINLGEKNIAGFISQFLLLGVMDQNGHILLATINGIVPNGQKLY